MISVFKHPYDIWSYSPKERFFKEPLRGVPFVLVFSFLYLIVLENLYPPTEQTFLSYFPKERFLKGSIYLSALSYLIVLENLYPPTAHVFYLLLCVWWCWRWGRITLKKNGENCVLFFSFFYVFNY